MVCGKGAGAVWAGHGCCRLRGLCTGSREAPSNGDGKQRRRGSVGGGHRVGQTGGTDQPSLVKKVRKVWWWDNSREVNGCGPRPATHTGAHAVAVAGAGAGAAAGAFLAHTCRPQKARGSSSPYRASMTQLPLGATDATASPSSPVVPDTPSASARPPDTAMEPWPPITPSPQPMRAAVGEKGGEVEWRCKTEDRGCPARHCCTLPSSSVTCAVVEGGARVGIALWVDVKRRDHVAEAAVGGAEGHPQAGVAQLLGVDAC